MIYITIVVITLIISIILVLKDILDSYTEKDGLATIVFILMIVASLSTAILLAKQLDNKHMEHNYKQFRDNNYTDYTNDIAYEHWLLDNTKEIR